MKKLKLVGKIEKTHGHKGTVMVKPLKDGIDMIMDLKKVCLVNGNDKVVELKVYEVREYRRGRFLIKFKGLKWKNEIEDLKNLILATWVKEDAVTETACSMVG